MPSPSGRIVVGNQVLFDAKAATGVSSTVIDVSGMTNVTVAVCAPANTALTFKFQGSLGKSVSSPLAPDFSATQAVTNQWDYLSAYDLNDPSSVIAGDTGVTLDNLTAAQNCRLYNVNVSLVRYLSMEVPAYTDGSLTAFTMGSTV